MRRRGARDAESSSLSPLPVKLASRSASKVRRSPSPAPPSKSSSIGKRAPACPLPTSPLASFEELRAHPDFTYLADNAFVVTGYRWRGGFSATALSLFGLHNETANVLSHLIGSLVFLALLTTLLISGPARVTSQRADSHVPEWPLAVFLLGAASCMGISAVYHLFAPWNQHVARFLQRLDYAGISFLIFASNVPAVVYAFACRPHLAVFYISLSAATNGVCAIMGLTDRFASQEWRGTRAASFAVAGASGMIPLVHALILSHRPDASRHEVLAMAHFASGLLSMGAQYLIGAALYALRLPERYAPGRYDYFSSHALFHCLVFSAAWTHWDTVQSLFLWRAELEAPCGL